MIYQSAAKWKRVKNVKFSINFMSYIIVDKLSVEYYTKFTFARVLELVDRHG